jgi:hypothetical protein
VWAFKWPAAAHGMTFKICAIADLTYHFLGNQRIGTQRNYVLMLYNPVEVHQSFGGTYHLCLQRRKVNQAKGPASCLLLLAECLSGLPLDLKDKGSMFLQKIENFCWTTWHDIRENSPVGHHCELRSKSFHVLTTYHVCMTS